jgi:hypothetical protein
MESVEVTPRKLAGFSTVNENSSQEDARSDIINASNEQNKSIDHPKPFISFDDTIQSREAIRTAGLDGT